MKAVIYARYSSDSQREESIEGQIRECTEYAEKQGFTLLASYIDRALSAKTANRPEFQRMVKDSARHMFDVVIVWKLDRFARNRNDSAHYKMILKKNNVKVISATERIAEDSTGILLESLLEGYAEFYSAELAEKVTRGMTENALKCKWNGGTIPLGFQIDSEQRMQINPLLAPIVREAFQKYADGGTVKSIVDWLYTKDVKNNRGNPVRIDMVQNMLKNRRYIGEYRFQKIVVPGGIPQIIPEDLFNRVQERMKKNKKAPARFKAEDRYLLTTKLFCGECGVFMAGECGTSRNGKIYHYYKCGNVKRKLNDCKKKNVRKDDIEHAVVSLTMKMLNNETYIRDIVDKLMSQQKKENTVLPHLKNQLSQTQKAIDNILNAIQEGIFTSSTKERLEALEQTKENLEIQIAQEELGKPLLTPEKILFWLERFKQIDISVLENREKLIDTFVNFIYLYDDRFLIFYNGREDTETVSYEVANCSDFDGFSPPFSEKSSTHAECRAFFLLLATVNCLAVLYRA